MRFAQVRRRSWAPKCSIPICFDDCSTTDQIAQSFMLSRLIVPEFETDRNSRPSSTPVKNPIRYIRLAAA